MLLAYLGDRQILQLQLSFLGKLVQSMHKFYGADNEHGNQLNACKWFVLDTHLHSAQVFKQKFIFKADKISVR